MRTQIELFDAISQEKAWRIKEILSINNLSKSANIGALERELYCRAGASLFYAHWEGYTKRSLEYYLKYISLQRLTIEKMEDFVLCILLKERMKTDNSVKLVESAKLLFNKQMRPKILVKSIINTQSNLSSTVLKNLLLLTGLPETQFATKFNAIDSKLLKNRNAVAHGAKGDVSLELAIIYFT